MEHNIAYFEVSSEQVCLEQTAELPIDADFTVADYLGEIKRVLKCSITPYVESKQIGTNTLTVTGTALITVLYLDPEDGLHTAEQEIPFQRTLEASTALENGSCEICADAVTHACRAVTERRFSIKGAVRLEVRVISIHKTPIVSDIDSDCFEQLRGEAPATLPLGLAEKSLIVDEELQLPDSMPAAERILRSEASATITDCKIVSNKVMIKGTVRLTVIYCSAEQTLQKYTASLPFNQIVDLIGITELCDCEAKVRVAGLNVSTRTAQTGECRSFMAVCKLQITAAARCNDQVPVLFDLYSTRYPIEISKNDVTFTRIIHQTDERFLCKKRITLPGDANQQILDLWCRMNNTGARCDRDGMMIGGGLTVAALTRAADGTVSLFERVIDFEYPIALEGERVAPTCRPEIDILSSDHTVIGSGEIELQVELMIRASIYDTVAITLITDVSVDESKPLAPEAALVAYFADAGENVWEISKSFLANRSELLELNHISEEIIHQPKMLLIPRM